MEYQEISEKFWGKVKPLPDPFVRKKSGDSPPIDFQIILNGILYILKIGASEIAYHMSMAQRVWFMSISNNGRLLSFSVRFFV
ncbi:hypothetical protein CCP3SC1_780005 [Gammaproteobacteria bacterium]